MFIFNMVISLLIPVVMVVFGALWRSNPPRHINYFAGYRTAMSMKNDETWRFAHRYFFRLWLMIGVPLAVVSAGVMAALYLNDVDTQANVMLAMVGVQMVALCLPIWPTEWALRRTFDDSGRAK